jgi:DegV family protein with EDD domain
MDNYVISCCSTVDMPKSWTKERSVYPAFFHLYVGADEYLDDFFQSIRPEQLYKRMLAGEHTRTSQVNVEEYEEHFRRFLKDGKDVLHITLSSGISGTVNSARIAAEDLKEEFPDRKIYIVDSLCASSGYGLLVDKAADLRDSNLSIDELRDWLEEHKTEVQHWFFTSDLTFFIRGGRVSKTAGLLGTILNICPLLHVAADGTLQPVEKVRTKKRVIEKTVSKMAELAVNGSEYDGKCFNSHSNCLEDAEAVRSRIETVFPHMKGKVQIYPIGSTIGCHTGPGTVALFFWGQKR